MWKPTDDGEWRLAVAFRVDDETQVAIQALEAEAYRLGRPSLGMSYSTSVSSAQMGDGDPLMLFAATPRSFTKDEILAAATLLPEEVSAEVAEYVDFALVDEIVNIVFVAQQNADAHVVELGLIGTAIAGTCKAWWRSGARIRYRVQLRRSNGTRTDIIAEADSEDDVVEFSERSRELEDRVNQLESELEPDLSSAIAKTLTVPRESLGVATARFEVAGSGCLPSRANGGSRRPTKESGLLHE